MHLKIKKIKSFIFIICFLFNNILFSQKIIINENNNFWTNVFINNKQFDHCVTIPGLIGKYPKKLQQILNQLKNKDINLEKDPSLRNRALLYGPPGNGKSTIVKKIQEHANCEIISIDGSSIVNPYIGSGPETLIKYLDEAEDLLEDDHEKKVIIFIDEIDAIAAESEGKNRADYKSSVQQLWLLMDTHKFNSRIFFFFATNDFNNLNKTFLDRFASNLIEIKNPDYFSRKELLYNFFNRANIQIDHKVVKSLALLTNGFSVRAIEDLVNDIRANAINGKISLKEIIYIYGQINKKNNLNLLRDPSKKLKVLAAVSVSLLQIYETGKIFKTVFNYIKSKINNS